VALAGPDQGHASELEPPIGIEPMTYALREAWPGALGALPAPIARIIALTAPTTVGLSGTRSTNRSTAAAPADSMVGEAVGVRAGRRVGYSFLLS
jgi:hypothetical protein